MMKKILALLLISVSPAWGQFATTTTTAPTGDSSTRIASTAFAQASQSATNVLTKGAKCDGSTDDSAAFTAMNAAGGSYFVPGGANCALANTVTLGSTTSFYIGQGAKFTWTGAASGTMFQSSNSAQLHDFSIVGNDPGEPSIVAGSAGIVFNLHSMQYSSFYDFQIQTNNAAATAWNIVSDSDLGMATSAANTAFNSWRNITHVGPVGTMMNLSGTAALHSANQVVTLNNFNNIWGGYKANSAGDINVCGICMSILVDNNNFDGQTYISIGAVNAIGVHINSSASPTVNGGVFAIRMSNLAVDCLGGPFTGRVGLQLDKSYLIRINTYYQAPTCEGGQAVAINAGSYLVDQNLSSTQQQVSTLSWFWTNLNILNSWFLFGNTSGDVTGSVSSTGGHLALSSNTTPSLTAGCNGTGSSVSGSDISGTVTGQNAAATSCTLTFATAFGAAPNCVAMGISSPLTGTATPGTGTLVVNFASTTNYKFTYICLGN